MNKTNKEIKRMIVMPTIFPVACHTDNIGKDSVFVAVPGKNESGVRYIEQAIQKGARTIVIEKNTDLSGGQLFAIQSNEVEIVEVENARLALAQLSAQAAGYPSRTLKIIGITGTKGKTTTSFLLAHMLRTARKKVALLSSVHNMINEQILPTELTTQHPDYLHQFFALCVENKIEYVVMEVAAQAFSLERTHSIEFDGAIFTNFSQEHGEFYATIDEYFESKMQIFNQAKSNVCLVINADNGWYEKIKGRIPEHIAFSFTGVQSCVPALFKSSNWRGVHFNVMLEKGMQEFECKSLIGDFNAYNCVAAALMARQIGASINDIKDAFKTFAGVPGRLELYHLSNGAYGIIDKAHNSSSFTAVLSTLRELTNNLIVVFGAGGDRDATKRPVMGNIAAEFADRVIVTSDNPRSENLSDIIGQIIAGMNDDDLTKMEVIEDRSKAIERAYKLSNAGAIIALLGKGADEYELVKGVKTYFSERQILQSLR